ncbi:MAG: regulatory iron-sulfur-containing complex subunit RicT [Bacteroidota bacterium]
MACTACSTSTDKNGKPKGCNSNGGCSSGGCNRLNTYDWLSGLDISDPEPLDIVEVSFKQGARKGFYRNPDYTSIITGDMVVVDTGSGHDIGKISLTGELVRLQLKKKRINQDAILQNIIRRANERDLQRLKDSRAQEVPTMIRARAIARSLDLEMKIGDVEYQGDRRKATFYYTADGRVDFRELIRHFAKEFRVKIEMRQIGARQESARIGGLGSCGRELCCSTWLSDFKSVSTAAARYQNLAINQSKLSGQCGRLKCCLNYELDTYVDALGNFPKGADKLRTEVGQAVLIKTDIFKGLMFYIYESSRGGKIHPLGVKRVKEILAMNARGEFPLELNTSSMLEGDDTPVDVDFEGDVTGVIELPIEKKKGRRRNRNRNRKKKEGASEDKATSNTPQKAAPEAKQGNSNTAKSPNQKRRNNRNRSNKKGGDNNRQGNKTNKPTNAKGKQGAKPKNQAKKKNDPPKK